MTKLDEMVAEVDTLEKAAKAARKRVDDLKTLSFPDGQGAMIFASSVAFYTGGDAVSI